MTLSGLKKEDVKKAPKSVEDFVYSATSKTVNRDQAEKIEKRDQSFLLKLNHYEIALINRVFENSKFRSKQELIRNLLLPELEKLNTIG
jgi:hypothetical protein